MIYLDSAATTKVFPEVLDNLKKIHQEYYANPNSIHPDGQKSRRAIDEVRRFFSQIAGAQEEEIIFTSCATESNNTVIKGLYEAFPEKNHVIVSPIEHKSVLSPLRYLSKKGVKVDFLNVDKNGIVDIDEIRKKITPKTLFVGIIHVNNETGVIQDLEEIGKLCREKDVLFFSDVVQSFGKINVPFDYLDFFSVSGHKINAPKGVGLLKRKKEVSVVPLLHGGGQEFGLRSGTENTSGIVSLKIAAEKWLQIREGFLEKSRKLENMLTFRLKSEIPEIKVVSEGFKVPYITTVLFPGVDGHSMVIALGRRGIAVSSGSACSTGSPLPSHVLLSYGFSEKDALSGVRFSFGFDTTEEDVETAVKETVEVYKKLLSFSGFS
ncbi:cysteine desulfurase [Persephonella atlantica]|uniref:cysteine desulfurase n=1 Tax=Persephonella atlantica TaxID=2699429 RepID=A0ABS1GJT6_9AQUI|nr:cysteine desulfurase family protein [Persephonella atlantica]MBK3333182.1 cysteine desulfurase [Persephonella atlantica]